MLTPLVQRLLGHDYPNSFYVVFLAFAFLMLALVMLTAQRTVRRIRHEHDALGAAYDDLSDAFDEQTGELRRTNETLALYMAEVNERDGLGEPELTPAK